MSLPISSIEAAIARLDVALEDWHDTTREPLSRYRRDREWTRGGEQVRLSICDSASRATVILYYTYGGAELAHLVLSSEAQVLPWLRLVGAVVPVPFELAAAALTPDAPELPNDDVYWRIYRVHGDTKFTVVCMQWFDEPDYDQTRFLNATRYTTEADALGALRTEVAAA